MHRDGTYVGRSAPEIDLIEATVEHGIGVVSQSSQVAPFDASYQWNNASENYKIGNSSRTALNTYLGGVFQQAVSAVTATNKGCYEVGTGCYSTYMFEYKPGFDGAVSAACSVSERQDAGCAADTNLPI
jgi:beta-glucanase (GH16 family)